MVSGCYPSTDWPCEKHCMEFCDGHPSDEVGSQEQLKREDGVGRSLTKPGGGGVRRGKAPPIKERGVEWALDPLCPGRGCLSTLFSRRASCGVQGECKKPSLRGGKDRTNRSEVRPTWFLWALSSRSPKMACTTSSCGKEWRWSSVNTTDGLAQGVLHSGAPIECQAGGLLFGELEHGKGRLFGQMESSAKVVGHRSCSCCLNCIGNSAGVLLGPGTAQHSGFEVLWPGQLVGLPHPSLLLELVEDRLVFLRSEGFCGDRGHLNSIAGARSLGSSRLSSMEALCLFAGFSDGGCSRTSRTAGGGHGFSPSLGMLPHGFFCQLRAKRFDRCHIVCIEELPTTQLLGVDR